MKIFGGAETFNPGSLKSGFFGKGFLSSKLPNHDWGSRTWSLGTGFWLASALVLASCAQPESSGGSSAAPVGPTTLNVADAAIAGGDPDMALSVSQSVLAADGNNVDAMVHEG